MLPETPVTSRAAEPLPPLDRVPARRSRSRFDVATSTSVLALALLGVTLLAAGPLQGMDQAAHGHWAQRLTPGLQPFVQQVLDPIAGQAVCLPVLVGVAVVLAWRNRTWRPLECVVAAEVAFYGGVGLFKVLLGRPAPTTDDADLFGGGLRTLGWSGISYPSGHAAEAVLVYGTAVYLIGRWSSASARTMRALRWGVGLIALNAVAVSYYLGWHWVTDLLGGLLVGGLLLRMLVEADRRDLWRSRPRRPRVRRRPSADALHQLDRVPVRVLDERHAQGVAERVRPLMLRAPGVEREGVGVVDVVGPQGDAGAVPVGDGGQPVALGRRPRQREPEPEAAEEHLDLERAVLRRPEGLAETEGGVEARRTLAVGDEQDDLRVREGHDVAHRTTTAVPARAR